MKHTGWCQNDCNAYQVGHVSRGGPAGEVETPEGKIHRVDPTFAS
jgi:hypothetical protein